VAKKTSDRYEPDEDGLHREIVGTWSAEKHLRLRHYVDITRATRRKYDRSGSSYIDLYCGSGRVRFKDGTDVRDGSPLVAAREAMRHDPFTQIHIGDKDADNVGACAERLARIGTSGVSSYVGLAGDVAERVVRALNPYGLHIAFLDPYSIGSLPFSVLQTLGQLKRMDLIMHVSEMDLQRNIVAMADDGTLDRFAPGWRQSVDLKQRNNIAKHQLLQHWKALLTAMGYQVSDNIERVTGLKNQPLYWLVLAAKHPLADKFWAHISHVEPQGRLF